MIHGGNIFDQSVKYDWGTSDNIPRIASGQDDAIDLINQQALDADRKAIQQINFTRNLEEVGNTTMFFITEEAKETILDFLLGTKRVS